MSDSRNYQVKENVAYGSVKIADDVVAMIAGLAAGEIEGVYSMAGNVGNELLARFGYKDLRKGISVVIDGNSVRVDIAIVVDYGFNIPKVSGMVQDKVKQSIESMTGLEVTDVNVRVAGIHVTGGKV